MSNSEKLTISLTGENSHKVTIPAGQGSLSIGTKGVSEGKYDVWVEKGHKINWDAFNEFHTPAGGSWPRFFYYCGEDKGFAVWSGKRPVENFYWMPKENASLDLTEANIDQFSLDALDNKIDITIGGKINLLSLAGRLEHISVKKCTAGIPVLNFTPLVSKTETQPYKLPAYKALEKAESVKVNVKPVGQAFDCESLLQFPGLKTLDLSGNLTNLEALAKLKHLKNIGLRYVPDLTGLPGLASWDNLTSFIGWNIEEAAGKVLKAELAALSKVKTLDYSSVSQLRKKIWFTTEYGIPFSGWESKNEKAATKAYKACLKIIAKAKTEKDVRAAIVGFIDTLNKLPNMETSEREDAGEAVRQLAESSPLGISQEKAGKWFDEARDF
ncbi:MAG: hypothetical protein FWG66_04685 [Spirochaetes bacterium]|nr:hypothetical protein [Spirochaetota bacterium]